MNGRLEKYNFKTRRYEYLLRGLFYLLCYCLIFAVFAVFSQEVLRYSAKSVDVFLHNSHYAYSPSIIFILGRMK